MLRNQFLREGGTVKLVLAGGISKGKFDKKRTSAVVRPGFMKRR